MQVFHPGLDGNPGKTGEVFSDSASYIRKSKDVSLDVNTISLFPHMDFLLEADTKDYRLDYFSDKGGFLQTNRKRIKEGEKNKQEKEKYDKEHSMCMTLAMGRHFVVYRESVQVKGNSYDIVLDGQPADLKKAKSANHIVDYAKKAVREQGASIVVFEFENETKEIYNEIESLKKKNIHGFYFFSDRKHKIYEF